MTTDEKLAAIEKRFAGYGAITYYETAWLIAEVRRLREAILDVGRKAEKVILESAELAIERAEDEYARGRADAVKAIREKANEYDATHSPTRFDLCYHDGDIADRLDSLADDIERGEHLEATDGP